MSSILGSRYFELNDTYHIMTQRYNFEKVRYVMKWLMPVIFVLFGFYILRARRPVVAQLPVSHELHARART